MDEYPSNSRLRQPAKPPIEEEKKPVERVTTGSVRRRKRSLGRRFSEFIAGDDTKGVMEYVFMDVLIPAGKDMIADAVSQGVERKLFGEIRGRGRGPFRGSGAGWTPYNRTSSLRREEPQRMSRRARAAHNFDELILDSRAEADTVLNGLYSLIQEYEEATVRDLYDLCGETASYTDEKFGWTDLGGANIRRVSGGGYTVILPRPEQLK